MINRNPLRLLQNFAGGRFLKPIYRDYSFANVSPTIFSLLTGKGIGPLLPPDCFGGSYPKPRKIALFFVDSFGFLFWQRYSKKQKFLKKITQDGVVTPISALFPSTTAASVSTMHLAVLPSQHALYEWNLYIPAYDDVIQTLPFSPLGHKSFDECTKLGYDPKYLLKAEKTIFQKLASQGVKNYHLVSNEFANSAYNSLVSRGAQIVQFASLETGLEQVKNILQAGKDKTYLSLYWGEIDAAAHKFGPESQEHEAEIRKFWKRIEKFFSDFQKPEDTLYLFTADHGSIGGDPSKTYYLNLEIPEIEEIMAKGKKGQVIYPNGAPRDVFLHIRPRKEEKVLKLLKRKLKGVARVMLTEDALKRGFFGAPPFDKEFIKRLGQILILPYPGRCVWWFEEGKLENRLLGHHGGLSREEMLSVFAAW